MKKSKILFILFLLITLISTISSASYSNVTMSVVEEPVCTINFGNSSTFTKQLISKNLNNKEVTLQLQVKNNEVAAKPTGEVMVVIDNSKSMLEKVNDTQTREDLVINSAKTLITNLLKDNTKLKIGVVSFSTNTDISKEGTAEDAKLISDLTNDSTSLLKSISNIEYDGPRTNLESGITLAKKYFTKDTDSSHKYLIVLTDGVPNVAINYDKNYYSDDVITKTKTALTSLSGSVDNVYVMLTGISDGKVVASPSTKTYDQIISEVFGTTEKPTVGKFYYVTDEDIEKTVTAIYNALLPVEKTFKNIKIVDYFPKEIINNFSFAYVSKANIGTISTAVDKTTNSITWTIPELKFGETATVQYKLKLKEDFNEEIVDKVLNTNTKVDLSYTDSANKTDSKTSNVTPKLKLEEPKPTVLPKAGKTALFAFVTISLIIVLITGFKYIQIKNKIK
ncbi:MAG: VWA domain-containing protein [Clostridia bacterium]